jgi:hypothetical protein
VHFRAEAGEGQSPVEFVRYNVDDADAEKKNSSNFLVKWIMLLSRGKYNIVLIGNALHTCLNLSISLAVSLYPTAARQSSSRSEKRMAASRKQKGAKQWGSKQGVKGE